MKQKPYGRITSEEANLNAAKAAEIVRAHCKTPTLEEQLSYGGRLPKSLRDQLLANAKNAQSGEMPYAEIQRFVERVFNDPRGKQRAGSVIALLARELANRGDKEGLDYALQEVTMCFRNCFKSES